MELQKDDWVRTETGSEGKIVLVSGMTIFVEIAVVGQDKFLGAFLASQLTKIDGPTTPTE